MGRWELPFLIRPERKEPSLKMGKGIPKIPSKVDEIYPNLSTGAQTAQPDMLLTEINHTSVKFVLQSAMRNRKIRNQIRKSKLPIGFGLGMSTLLAQICKSVEFVNQFLLSKQNRLHRRHRQCGSASSLVSVSGSKSGSFLISKGSFSKES